MLALLLQQRLLLLLLLLPVLLLLQQQLRLPRVSFLPTPRKTVQHASAYVSIRQYTSEYVSIASSLHLGRRCSMRQHTAEALQHTSAYVSIRQHTSA